MSEIQGRQSTDERGNTPMMIPMSDLVPPWSATNMGRRKKAPKLVTVKKLAMDMVRKGALKSAGGVDVS
jgi:hypothetical protein